MRLPEDATLTAGKGYLINPSGYINGVSTNYEDITFHFDSSAASPVTLPGNDVTVDLTEHESVYAQNAGWNFIGNPYLSYYDTRFIDFDGPITVRSAKSSSNSGTYEAFSLIDDSKILAPYEAFFVQYSATANSLEFHKEGQQFSRVARTLDPAAAPSRVKAVNPNRVLVNLTLSDGDFTDRTRVVLNPDASEAYEPNCDAAKFWTEDATTAQICSMVGGVEYAINELPLPDNDITLRTRTAAGNFAIALDKPIENYTVELIDLKTGDVADLGAEAYEYEAESTDSPQRFALRLTSGLSGVGNISVSVPAADNSWYNMQGVRLNGEPTAAGLYIHNGKKVIIK